jgi:hypothetical protein
MNMNRLPERLAYKITAIDAQIEIEELIAAQTGSGSTHEPACVAAVQRAAALRTIRSRMLEPIDPAETRLP